MRSFILSKRSFSIAERTPFEVLGYENTDSPVHHCNIDICDAVKKFVLYSSQKTPQIGAATSENNVRPIAIVVETQMFPALIGQLLDAFRIRTWLGIGES